MKGTAERKGKFIAALTRGAPPVAAAQSVGIDRATAYRWRASDRSFAEKWAEATDCKTELIEAVLFREALAGQPWAVCFFLKSNKPATYNRRQHDADAFPLDDGRHDAEPRVVIHLPANFRDRPAPDDPATIEGEAA